MATARDIIKGSLRLIGALASGETPAAEDANDALTALNDMIDSWSNESLLIYQIVRESFALSAGTAAYTIGSGGTFDTARPMKIETALIQDGASPPSESPMKILTSREFAEIAVKTVQSSLPTYIYPDDAYPLMTLNLYPVPSEVNNLILYSWKPLTTFTNLSTSASLPPGYLRALRFNLAIELAPEYGRPAPAEVIEIASEAKGNIKRMNNHPLFLSCDPATLRNGQFFNWLTGGSGE